MRTTKRPPSDTDPPRGADVYVDFSGGKYLNCPSAHLKHLNLIGQVIYREKYLKAIGVDARPPNNVQYN